MNNIRDGMPAQVALLRSAVMLSYTTLFGAFEMFVLVRTGHLVPVVMCHSFCNLMQVAACWTRGGPSLRATHSCPAPLALAFLCFLPSASCWVCPRASARPAAAARNRPFLMVADRAVLCSRDRVRPASMRLTGPAPTPAPDLSPPPPPPPPPPAVNRGLPSLSWLQPGHPLHDHRVLIGASYAVGIVGFAALLFPATEPSLYGSKVWELIR